MSDRSNYNPFVGERNYIDAVVPEPAEPGSEAHNKSSKKRKINQ
jgi:hypothetical protein